MKTASLRTALIAAAIVAIGAFILLRIGGADAQSDCIRHIDADGAFTGSWTSDCLSENTPTEPTNPPPGIRYARFYTFTLSEDEDITIDLTSDTDTYLYLMEGTGANGAVLHENDDAESGNTNSRIEETLTARDYTVEATTFELTTTGDFALTVSGLPNVSTPTVTPTLSAGNTPTITPTPTSGQAEPTRTATPTISPTPTQPPASDNVLNRLTALETRAATQQKVIATLESKVTALDGRVVALEAGAANLTATPTATNTPKTTTTPTTIPTSTTYTPTPGATSTPEPTATNTPMATATATPAATATREPIATNTPTPRPTPVASFTGAGVFEEIDRLGASEFNSRYSGKYIEISAFWDGVLLPPAGRSGPRNYYGVAEIEEPSEELVFIWTSFTGIWWTYSYTEPHDGRIIVGAGTGSIFTSRRSYTCRVDEYASGTLDLKSCRSVSSTSNENSQNIPARVFESYSSGGHN